MKNLTTAENLPNHKPLIKKLLRGAEKFDWLMIAVARPTAVSVIKVGCVVPKAK